MPTGAKRVEDTLQIDDSDSVKGRFCWEIVADTCIPCLLRDSGTVKYVPVTLGESKVLGRYLKFFTAELFECVVVQSYQTTKAEVALLNTIDEFYCDNTLYPRKFKKEKEAIVRLQDFRHYYEFLDTCYRKLKQIALSDGQRNRCGFIRLNNESVVPYVVKDDVTYMPLFYFEGDTGTLGEQTIDVRDWDLAYLKFCCKMQGIRNTIFGCDVCAVVSFDVIKKYFPEDTIFEDYWPVELHPRMLLSHSLKQVNGNPWVLSPFTAPGNTNLNSSRSVIDGPPGGTMNPSFPNNGQNCVVSTANQPSASVQMPGYPGRNYLPPRFPYNSIGIQSRPTTPAPNITVNGNIYTYSAGGNVAVNSVPRGAIPQHPNKNGRTKGNGNQLPSNGGGLLPPHMTPPPGGNLFPPQGPSPNIGHPYSPQLSSPYLPQASRNPVPPPLRMSVNGVGRLAPVTTQMGRPRCPTITPTRAPGQSTIRRVPVATPAANASPAVTPVRLIRTVATNDPTNGRKNAGRKRVATGTTSSDVIDLISPPSSPGPAPISDMNPTEPRFPIVPELLQLPNTDGASYDITTTSLYGMKLCCISSSNGSNPYILLGDVAKEFSTTLEDLKYELQVVLKLTLYRANEDQQKLLFQNQKCELLNEEVPLISLSDLNLRMTHLQYLHKKESQPSKRTKH